jgi:pimeloyl-ACP methyl ester carboxylesterase
LGYINSSEFGKNTLFFGSIILDDNSFQAKIIIKQNLIQINGLHKDSFLPMLTGDYNIGTKTIHLIDENRNELFTPDNLNDFREVIAQIWYPVDKNIISDRIDYMDDLTFQWLFERSPVPLITIPKNAYEYVRPYSYNEAPVASEPDSFPLIIFSHGYDGVYQIYTSLIEDLVSNGFIVVSINHPYVAGIVVFPDGDVVRVANVDTNVSLPSVVGDIKFVLDEITKINKNDSFFAGKFDLSNVGLYGHSFGGAATAICCYEDPRIKAGLTLDGYFSGEDMIKKIPEDFDKPFLMVVAEGRLLDPGTDYFWNLLDDDVYKVEVIGSTHYGYTDVGILLNHFVPLIPSEPLGFGTINPKRLTNITKSYEITFFQVYLKNYSVDELYNLSSNFEEVIFLSR